ncbi:gamma-glutamyl-gamma-aminobutyrate hydrolase family protein [Candidatus Marinimicrobia bacterium]|nr:gamma-glutamyl-gamma-aminobutyrate hydrolase family protein [Candidatus Neomarinimicrobiota bacterium]
MSLNQLMVIDPAAITPSIEAYNRISKVAPLPVTYHLPALYNTDSLFSEYKNNLVKGIIILGSATSVNNPNIWQNKIVEILLDASKNNIPILGLCYGHQLISKVFGGKVEPLWNGQIKQGNRLVHLKKSSMWGELKSGQLLYSHQDGVTKVPHGFNVIASSDMVPIEAIASENKPIWGFQAHLEATNSFVKEHKMGPKGIQESFDFGHRLLDSFLFSLK